MAIFEYVYQRSKRFCLQKTFYIFCTLTYYEVITHCYIITCLILPFSMTQFEVKHIRSCYAFFEVVQAVASLYYVSLLFLDFLQKHLRVISSHLWSRALTRFVVVAMATAY